MHSPSINKEEQSPLFRLSSPESVGCKLMGKGEVLQVCILLSAVVCNVGRPVPVQEEHTRSSSSSSPSTTVASTRGTPIDRQMKRLAEDDSPPVSTVLDSHIATVKLIASSVFGGLVVVTIAVALFVASKGKRLRRHESKFDLPEGPPYPQGYGNGDEASPKSVPTPTPHALTPLADRPPASSPNLGDTSASVTASGSNDGSTKTLWKNAQTAYSVSLSSQTFGGCSDTVDESFYSATLGDDSATDGDEQNRYRYKTRHRTNSFMEPGSVDTSTHASQNEQS